MPTAVDCDLDASPNTLRRRDVRSQRRAALAKVNVVGQTLYKLDVEERAARNRLLDPQCVNGEFCNLVRALDVIRERRRILLGIPLPGTVNAGGKRRLLDIPQAQVRDAVLIPDTPIPYQTTVSDAATPQT